MEHACVVSSWNDLISNTCLMGVRYAIFCNFISYVFCVSLVSFVYTDFVFRWYLLSIQILCFAGILLSIQILCFAGIFCLYRFCVSLVFFCLYRFCVSLVFFCLYRFSFYCTVTSNTFIFKTLTYEEILSAYNFLKIFKCYDYPITAKN
jgi:hypothetical protein